MKVLLRALAALFLAAIGLEIFADRIDPSGISALLADDSDPEGSGSNGIG